MSSAPRTDTEPCLVVQIGDHLLRWQQQTGLSRRRPSPEMLSNVLFHTVKTEMPVAVQACLSGRSHSAFKLSLSLNMPLMPSQKNML